MFKKFDEKEDVIGSQKLKSSTQVLIVVKRLIFLNLVTISCCSSLFLLTNTVAENDSAENLRAASCLGRIHQRHTAEKGQFQTRQMQRLALLLRTHFSLLLQMLILLLHAHFFRSRRACN